LGVNTSSSHAESGCSLEQQRVCGTESTIGASTPGQQNIENVETASGSVTANQTEKDISSTEENASDEDTCWLLDFNTVTSKSSTTSILLFIKSMPSSFLSKGDSFLVGLKQIQNIENVETASGSVTANQTEKDISSTEENASDDNNSKESTSNKSIIADSICKRKNIQKWQKVGI
jgi:hypothetical protein